MVVESSGSTEAAVTAPDLFDAWHARHCPGTGRSVRRGGLTLECDGDSIRWVSLDARFDGFTCREVHRRMTEGSPARPLAGEGYLEQLGGQMAAARLSMASAPDDDPACLDTMGELIHERQPLVDELVSALICCAITREGEGVLCWCARDYDRVRYGHSIACSAARKALADVLSRDDLEDDINRLRGEAPKGSWVPTVADQEAVERGRELLRAEGRAEMREACARILHEQGPCRYVDHVQGFCCCGDKEALVRALDPQGFVVLDQDEVRVLIDTAIAHLNEDAFHDPLVRSDEAKDRARAEARAVVIRVQERTKR